MTNRRIAVGVLLALPAILLGCQVPEEAGFPDVERLVKERIPEPIHWNRGTPEDAAVTHRIRDMLREELSAERAVQIALLNSRTLQAEYEELGVSQADLVQAGLLRNPVFSSFAGIPATSHTSTSWAFSLVQDFLDLLLLPARMRIAGAEFEETKLRVGQAILEHAAETARAFFSLVSAEQIVAMRRVVVEAAAAAFELARRMHVAGNMNDRDLAIERGAYEEARVALARAEAAALAEREHMNSLLGVWGEETHYRVAGRLPDLPADEIPLVQLESLAVANRLDLAALRWESLALREALETARDWRWIGGVDVGAETEREPEDEDVIVVGPTASVELPIFDQRQAQIARLEAIFRQSEHRVYAKAVEIRSEVRAARDRLVASRRLAEQYRDVIVPVREEIVAETKKHQNYMLLGAFDLLLAKRDEIEAYQEYIEAVRDYWLAKTDLAHALGGRLPGPSNP